MAISNLGTQEKLNIISSLATLLSAGIPLLESVDSLLTESKGNTKGILTQLKEDLSELKIDHLGAFAYSKEEDTKAALMQGQISSRIRTKRQREIKKLPIPTTTAIESMVRETT